MVGLITVLQSLFDYVAAFSLWGDKYSAEYEQEIEVVGKHYLFGGCSLIPRPRPAFRTFSTACDGKLGGAWERG